MLHISLFFNKIKSLTKNILIFEIEMPLHAKSIPTSKLFPNYCSHLSIYAGCACHAELCYSSTLPLSLFSVSLYLSQLLDASCPTTSLRCRRLRDMRSAIFQRITTLDDGDHVRCQRRCLGCLDCLGCFFIV